MVTAADLKRRWSEPERLRLVREVRSWLVGQGPRPQGLEDVGGRVDLRGIPLTATPATVGDKDDPSAGVVWESLDLTGAQLDQLRVFGGRILDCVFDAASVVGLKLWGSEVADCSFRRADLRSGALGTGDWHGRRTLWRRVAFDRANLREAVFAGCSLQECTFEKTSKLLLIVDSEVTDCVFRGPLNSLLIDGRGHRFPVAPTVFSADFSQALLEDSKVEGYVLDQVRWPDQPGLVVVRRYPQVFRDAAAWLANQATTEAEQRAAAILTSTVKAPGREDSDICIDLNGYGNADIIEAVTRALDHAQRR